MMKWNFSLKDIIYIIIIGVGVFFGWRLYKDLKAEVHKSSIAYKQLSETLARAQNELATKEELKQFAESMDVDLGDIKKDLKDIGADLAAVGVTVATIEGKVEKNQGSSGSNPHDPPEQPDECNLCDIHGYTASTQLKEISIGDMPYGMIEFDASKKKPWTLKYDDIDVKVTTVMGEKENDELNIFYHTISLMNKSRPDLQGKEYKLKVTSSVFKQTQPSNKEFYWWAPHLDISIDNLVSFDKDVEYNIGASLGISAMAYGFTKNDNDWRFVRIGLGFNNTEDIYISFDPVRYNIGRSLPLVSDLWIGAGIMYSGSWGLTLSLGTTL